MWFSSTKNPALRIDCRTAILSAYAPDGGLLIPGKIPTVDQDELRRLSKLSYVSLLANLMSRFLHNDEDTSGLFNAENLEKVFSDLPSMFDSKDDIIPIRTITADGVDSPVAVAELYHGPSLAFKDLATVPACRVMDACLEGNKAERGEPKRGVVSVSTSGDTGASVSGAVQCTKRLDVVVLLPGGNRVAKIQERQTVTWPGENVHVFVGDATSDNLDLLAARMQEGSPLADASLVATAKKHGFIMSSLNSLNPLRVLAQLAPFFYVYLKHCPNADRKVCFVLPTGGAGNLATGCLARRMGLPVEFVVALNANASLSRLFNHFDGKGECVYAVPDSVRTLAPAMDMGIPYNFPRVVHFITNSDKPAIDITANPETGEQRVKMSFETVKTVRSALYSVESADDTEIERTMRMVAAKNDGYVVCPHTATGVSAAVKVFGKGNSEKFRDFAGVVVVSTASPAKFVEALERADLAKSNKAVSDLMQKLDSLPVKSHDLKASSKLPAGVVPYEEWFSYIGGYLENTVFTKK